MATVNHTASGPAFPRLRTRHGSGVAALLALLAAVTMVTVASASSGPAQLKRANVPGFHGILVAANGWSLYALSVERGGVIHCRASCFSFWVPLEVKSSVTHVSFGPGVKGKIGFVKRTATMKQVTFNTFPVYEFTGDSGAGQTNGEGVKDSGGTWDLVNAGTTAPGSTQVKHDSTSSTTTTSSPTTSTTSSQSTTTVPTSTTTMPYTTTTRPYTTTTLCSYYC
ncbi:MAG: hypothetical protein ACHQFZ_01185 [Acidimicrobiales bacterium]